MQECKLFRQKGMRSSRIKQNRSRFGVDRKCTEYNLRILLGFFDGGMVHTSVFNNSGLGFGRLWWLSFGFMFWTSRNILLQRTLSCNVARITTLVAQTVVRLWSLYGKLSTTFLGFLALWRWSWNQVRRKGTSRDPNSTFLRTQTRRGSKITITFARLFKDLISMLSSE